MSINIIEHVPNELENGKETCKDLFWRADALSYCYDGKIGVRKSL